MYPSGVTLPSVPSGLPTVRSVTALFDLWQGVRARDRAQDWKSCVIAVDASRIWTLAEPADDILFEAGVAVAPRAPTPAGATVAGAGIAVSETTTRPSSRASTDAHRLIAYLPCCDRFGAGRRS